MIWSNLKVNKCLKLYTSGMSIPKVSKELRTPMSTVRYWLKKYGVLKTISEANSGERNGMWKGDKVGYNSLHEWIRNHLEKPQSCDDCNQVKPLDLANISQEYKRDFSDWEWLCRRCHMIKEGRIYNLKGRIINAVV